MTDKEKIDELEKRLKMYQNKVDDLLLNWKTTQDAAFNQFLEHTQQYEKAIEMAAKEFALKLSKNDFKIMKTQYIGKPSEIHIIWTQSDVDV